MRIEPCKHAVDCRFDELAVIGFLDVIGAHSLEHFAEQTELPIGVDEAALVPITNTVCGCAAKSVSPAPATAPRKMREVLRIIRKPVTSVVAPRASMTTASLAGLWLLPRSAGQVPFISIQSICARNSRRLLGSLFGATVRNGGLAHQLEASFRHMFRTASATSTNGLQTNGGVRGSGGRPAPGQRVFDAAVAGFWGGQKWYR